MYEMKSQFHFDMSKAMCNPKSVFKGNYYRITILTDSLVRLEYNKDGIFNDNPTELVFYRNFDTPVFEVKDSNNVLKIKTKYFTLSYRKEKGFKGTSLNPASNLSIKLNKSGKSWYYDHHEVRNYSIPFFIDENNKEKKQKSLFSLDGFCTIDDSNTKRYDELGRVIEGNTKPLDLYVFLYGNDFKVCLKDYFLLTGYPPLIPRFALGNWWYKNDIYNYYSLVNLINKFTMEKIPFSVVLLNKFWHNCITGKNNYLDTGFTFNSQLFDNPKNVIDYLHSKNIRLGLNINPFEGIYPTENNFSKISDGIETDGSGVIPFNVMNSNLIDKYFDYLIYPLNNLGVDFYWIDGKNKYNTILKQYHFKDFYKDLNRRPLIYGYNSKIAAHRYPVLYAGESTVSWESLKAIPTFNSNASNLGICFYSHDIGGFKNGIEDNELFTRYVQLGTFSPILKLGSDTGKYYKRIPSEWGIKTSLITSDYLRLRYKLIPYIYSEAYRYHKTGISFIQPLYYQYPYMYDDTIYNNEYYFGSQMLVSPIVTKKDYIMNRVIHKFFMPKGVWYDYQTGKRYNGDKKYVSFYRDEDYPVFVKSGAIIPTSLDQNNSTSVPKNLEIAIFPGKSNLYNLYEDDGISNNYLEGGYLITTIEYNYSPNSYSVIIRPTSGKKGIIHDYRNYRIKFRNTKFCDNVSVYSGNKKIGCRTYTSSTNFIIDIPNISTSEQLTIYCKGTDVEIDAIRIINEDIESIIQDLPIDTTMKEKIDKIIFSEDSIKNKRIGIRKLGHANKYLEKKYVELFLKLLEYINQV